MATQNTLRPLDERKIKQFRRGSASWIGEWGKDTFSLAKLHRLSQRRPSATRDLHGHTVIDAYRVTAAFLHSSICKGHEIVQICHGKGKHSPHKRAILRPAVRDWLKESPVVMAFITPQGNQGMVLVLLKQSEGEPRARSSGGGGHTSLNEPSRERQADSCRPGSTIHTQTTERKHMPTVITNRPYIRQDFRGRGITLRITGRGGCYFVPHDALVDIAGQHFPNPLQTQSWREEGIYSWPPQESGLGPKWLREEIERCCRLRQDGFWME